MAKTDVSTLDALDSEIVFDSATVQNIDGAALNNKLMHAIADATDVDSILDANVAQIEKLKALWDAGTEWVRNPVTVLSVDFNESNEEFAEGGWGFYAVMQVADSDGVVHILSTGAKTIVLKLRQIQKHGSYPMQRAVRFTGTKTKSNFIVFDMVKAEA
jgi:RNAse (barnase) inhibitor barstar